jgi:ectoine hydroxylase-related dioxygenase (phytanoyl-CoA dioxygenase family)
MQSSRRFSPDEKAALERDGFVVRRAAFDARELREIAAACEELCRRLLSLARRRKWPVGAYVFELQRELGTMVKWEAHDHDALQGVEPFAHLSEALNLWAHDPRFLAPMQDVVGVDEVALFTEKLNVKRGRVGGPIVLHQDHPYWVDVAENADEVGTAMLFIDEATLENGCLEVVPGSHRAGEMPRREVEDFGQFEMDAERFDTSRLVPLVVPAGTVVYFGPFLVHRSQPNRTERDRRALLYSYQPAGRKHMRDVSGFAGQKR